MIAHVRWRHGLVTGAMCLAFGCGDDSTTAPTPTQSSLLAGSYFLTLSAVTTGAPQPCPDATLAATRVAIPVQVSGTGPVWTVQPEGVADLGLRGRIEAVGIGAGGTMSGAAQDPASSVVATVSDIPPLAGTSLPGFPVVLLGRIDSPRAASGTMSGEVRFTLGAAVRRCLANEWRLDAR